MRKLQLYLDTSVINFVYADDAPEFKEATLQFLEEYADQHELFISDTVLFEIGRDPDEDHRNKLFEAIVEYSIRELSAGKEMEVRRMAWRYLDEGVVPLSKLEDAFHIAYATVYEMDMLISWNFKHLANVGKESRTLMINLYEGYRKPLRLTSPMEFSHE